ncbi:hypothetical protein BT67DRAFT_139026 [Trichocladium antarcticum]|uniref:Uncharacterized protein n=1 Tax=Trichocladium antarcticum TaxID=1450529 RepID=A0AAN6UHU7_9PEZI|nr:hypothetical protein BT67DRAFT_139026 [Trichocladium antarcticum]
MQPWGCRRPRVSGFLSFKSPSPIGGGSVRVRVWIAATSLEMVWLREKKKSTGHQPGAAVSVSAIPPQALRPEEGFSRTLRTHPLPSAAVLLAARGLRGAASPTRSPGQITRTIPEAALCLENCMDLFRIGNSAASQPPRSHGPARQQQQESWTHLILANPQPQQGPAAPQPVVYGAASATAMHVCMYVCVYGLKPRRGSWRLARSWPAQRASSPSRTAAQNIPSVTTRRAPATRTCLRRREATGLGRRPIIGG